MKPPQRVSREWALYVVTFRKRFQPHVMKTIAVDGAPDALRLRGRGCTGAPGEVLLLTMLLHAAINNTKDIVPSYLSGATNPLSLHASLVAWLTVALLWIGAAVFLVQMRSAKSAERSR